MRIKDVLVDNKINIDVLVDNKINKEKILCEIWQNVNENSIAEDYYLKDEVSIIIRYLEEAENNAPQIVAERKRVEKLI